MKLLDPIRFKFEPELEKRFRLEAYQMNKRIIRLFLISSIALFALFSFLDQLSLPESYNQAWFVRFIIMIPILIITLFASYRTSFENHYEIVLTFVAILEAYSILYMIGISEIHEPAYTNYQQAIYIVIFSAVILLRLRINYTILLIAAIILAYEYLVIFVQKIPLVEEDTTEMMINNFYFLSICTGGILTSYIVDYFRRKSFLERVDLTNAIEDLQETSEKLSAIANNEVAGISVIDSENKHIYVNDAWCKMIGYSEDELVHLSKIDVTHPEDREITEDFFKRTLEGTINDYNIEKRYIRKDGSVFWGNLYVSPIRDRAGEIVNIITIVVDITDRKLIQQTMSKLNLERDNYLSMLNKELNIASDYVHSLLPPPLESGIIRSEWKLEPSTNLGGDHFGYHWLDSDNFAMYLVDVCGHGVAPALHAISVINVLRNKTLPNTDFTVPKQVLQALNQAFQMPDHNDMYFTMWYGVFNKYSRKLVYASGAHPGALLVDSEGVPIVLETENFMIGGLEEYDFVSKEIEIPVNSKLFIFSDGVYEIQQSNGKMWELHDLYEYLTSLSLNGGNEIDMLYEHSIELNSGKKLDDDFSILKIEFR